MESSVCGTATNIALASHTTRKKGIHDCETNMPRWDEANTENHRPVTPGVYKTQASANLTDAQLSTDQLATTMTGHQEVSALSKALTRARLSILDAERRRQLAEAKIEKMTQAHETKIFRERQKVRLLQTQVSDLKTEVRRADDKVEQSNYEARTAAAKLNQSRARESRLEAELQALRARARDAEKVLDRAPFRDDRGHLEIVTSARKDSLHRVADISPLHTPRVQKLVKDAEKMAMTVATATQTEHPQLKDRPVPAEVAHPGGDSELANENRTLREQLLQALRTISELKETAIEATKTKTTQEMAKATNLKDPSVPAEVAHPGGDSSLANENRTLREQLQQAQRTISELKDTAIKATKTKTTQELKDRPVPVEVAHPAGDSALANENRTLREQLQQAKRTISELKETAIKATKTKVAPSLSSRGAEFRPLVTQTAIRLDAQEHAEHVMHDAKLQAEWDKRDAAHAFAMQQLRAELALARRMAAHSPHALTPPRDGQADRIAGLTRQLREQSRELQLVRAQCHEAERKLRQAEQDVTALKLTNRGAAITARRQREEISFSVERERRAMSDARDRLARQQMELNSEKYQVAKRTEWVETGFRAHAHKLRMTSRQHQRQSKELVDSILAKLKATVLERNQLRQANKLLEEQAASLTLEVTEGQQKLQQHIDRTRGVIRKAVTHAAVAVHRQLRHKRMADKHPGGHPGGARHALLVNGNYKNEINSTVVETKATDVTRGLANNVYPPRGVDDNSYPPRGMAAEPSHQLHVRQNFPRGANVTDLHAHTLGVTSNTLGVTSNKVDTLSSKFEMNANTLGVQHRAKKISLDAQTETQSTFGVNSSNIGVSSNTFGVNSNTLGVTSNTLGVNANTLGVNSNTLGVNANTLGVTFNTHGVNANTLGVNSNTLGVTSNTHGVNANTLGGTSNVIGLSSNTLGVSGLPFVTDVADIGAEIFALNDRCRANLLRMDINEDSDDDINAVINALSDDEDEGLSTSLDTSLGASLSDGDNSLSAISHTSLTPDSTF